LNDVCVDAINSVNRNGSIVDSQKFCTGPLTGGEPNQFKHQKIVTKV
jgi:hypothetical protein